jgi:AraC family transcriptional regulator
MDARDKTEADRLSAVVLNSIQEGGATADLARRAYRSRTHFYRLFQALIDETPGAMRRRLLLERSAYQLGRTRLSVTDIALEAIYGSLEAFTRAFRRAFGISPSLYRRMGATHFRLPAPNGIHFCASGSPLKGTSDMDLFDRFAGHDSWHTRRLLEQAGSLTDDQLDKPLKGTVKVLPWQEREQNLRELLERIVQTKEVWTAALTGRDMPSIDPSGAAQDSPAKMLARYEKVDAEFNRILRTVRDNGTWDDTFVDALCDPPETFTFGGMFAHLITFNNYRRLAALAALRSLGVGDSGFGCPTEYEASVAPWRVEQVGKTR